MTRLVAIAALAASLAGCTTAAEETARLGSRTREILAEQHDAKPAKVAPMSGAEARRILENYTKSIGKGGAGADLPPKAATQ
jgi:hypothetical protein